MKIIVTLKTAALALELLVHLTVDRELPPPPAPPTPMMPETLDCNGTVEREAHLHGHCRRIRKIRRHMVTSHGGFPFGILCSGRLDGRCCWPLFH